MNDDLINKWLYSDEGDSLDFKKELYKMDQEKSKSEFLKDIIAFGNSWREEIAYIVMGIEEVKGGRNKVLGIKNEECLEESHIQQFISGKLQKPIIFSYNILSFEGKKIHAISIPVQNRPFYSKKNYGVVEKKLVYVRRGSSTNVADPDEIADMGAENLRRQSSGTLISSEGKTIFKENDRIKIVDSVLGTSDYSSRTD